MLKIITLLTSFVFATAAHSAQPTPDSVETLLASMNVEKMLDSMILNKKYQVTDQLIDEVLEKSIPAVMQHSMSITEQGRPLSIAEQRQAIYAAPAKLEQSLPAKLDQMLNEKMAWDKMRPLYIKIYQEIFTQEEIDGLIAFYKSPLAIAINDKMPAAMKKTTEITQLRMAQLVMEMKTLIQQAVEKALAAK